MGEREWEKERESVGEGERVREWEKERESGRRREREWEKERERVGDGERERERVESVNFRSTIEILKECK